MVLTDMATPPAIARLTPSMLLPTGCAPIPDKPLIATMLAKTSEMSNPMKIGRSARVSLTEAMVRER